MHTPRTQVARTLRAQCPCRGGCCAHSKQVKCACELCRARSCACPRRDPTPRSRPQIDVVTSLCSFHRNNLVATQNLGRDTKPPCSSQNHVATSDRCRDTTQATPGRDLKTGSRHRFSYPAPSQVATPKPGRDPFWRLTYVATSILCCDLVSAHNGISRSRRPTPGRDLPHCYPCRDLKMMSRPQISSAPA